MNLHITLKILIVVLTIFLANGQIAERKIAEQEVKYIRKEIRLECDNKECKFVCDGNCPNALLEVYEKGGNREFQLKTKNSTRIPIKDLDMIKSLYQDKLAKQGRKQQSSSQRKQEIKCDDKQSCKFLCNGDCGQAIIDSFESDESVQHTYTVMMEDGTIMQVKNIEEFVKANRGKRFFWIFVAVIVLLSAYVCATDGCNVHGSLGKK